MYTLAFVMLNRLIVLFWGGIRVTQKTNFHFIEFNTNNNVLLHFVLHTFRCRNSVGFVSLSGETRRQRNKSRQYKNSGVETDLSHCQVRQGDNAIKAESIKIQV